MPGLFSILDEAGLDPTPVEVAEALWLARFARAPAREPPGAEDPGFRAPDAGEAAPPAPATPRDRAGGPRPAESSGRKLPLYLPGPAAARGTEHNGLWSRTVRVPAASALPGTQPMLRALRPLRWRAPDSHQRVLDEGATASISAQCGSVIPVLRDGSERALSLTLVVDTGPAMSVWSKLDNELTELFHRLGAFRDLQKWYLRTVQGMVLGVSRSRQQGQRAGSRARSAGPVGELRSCGEIADPAGRRLILFLTDGSGPAWYTGEMARVLREWGSQGPVAVLQPLPQQLWARTGLEPVPGRLVSPQAAASNSRLVFHPPAPVDLTAGRAAPVPVPILGLGPEWLAEWASFVSGQGGGELDCTVTLASGDPPRAYPEPDFEASPSERVQHFAEQASPQALQLAVYLSASDLSLPVMRQVQAVMLPGTGPSHLAEVLLGGLLSTKDAAQSPDSPEEWRYEFAEGVREVLYGGLGRSQARRVLRIVSQTLAARLGLSADEFTAALGASSGTATTTLPMTAKPFAEIAAQVLQRVTGQPRYGEVPAAEPGPAPDDPAEHAAALIRRYERSGRVSDLDEAIDILTAPAPETPPGTDPGNGFAERADSSEDAARRALRLSLALRLRYSATGQRADLDEESEVLRDAVAASPPGPSRARLLAEQSTAHGLRYTLTGDPGDLDNAIASARGACAEPAGTDADRARYAGALGAFLLRRAQSTGRTAELDEVISQLSTATAQPLPDAERARMLTHLATALRLRAGGASPGPSAVDDLDSAIGVMRSAVRLTPETSADLASRQAELGAGYLARATASGDARDLRAAAAAYRHAADVPSARATDIAESRAGLGIALRELARRGDVDVLPEAVRSLRIAVSETPENEPARSTRLAALADALLVRSELSASQAELAETAHLLNLAASLSSAGSSDRALYLEKLSDVYERRYQQTNRAQDRLLAREASRKAMAIREAG